MVTILYKITATGAVQIWEIERLYNQASLSIMFGQEGGSRQHKLIRVKVNKSSRNLREQITLEADSRIKKQKDKGYCESVIVARNSIGLNASKMLKPMLAHKLIDKPYVDYKKCFVQYKYNGHRCLITSTEDGLVAYSRNGKPITTIDHILSNLNLEVGRTLDGELYIHGTQLQDTGSLIRKQQPGNEKLNFVCYDTMINLPYEKRLDVLCSLSLPNNVFIAPTIFGSKLSSLSDRLHEAIELGYEGLILRTNDAGYESGKRSSSLIKVKQFQDAEFIVTNIHASSDDWGILECINPLTGATFRVSAPGTIDEKKEILTNKMKYIGKFINVEYFDLTNDGKPFHPVAKYFRY